MASVTSLLTEGGLVLPLWDHGWEEPARPGQTRAYSSTAPFLASIPTRTDLVPRNVVFNPNLAAFLQREMSRIFADTADRPNLPADARIEIEHGWKRVEKAAIDRSGWREVYISHVLQVACEVILEARNYVGRLCPGPASSNAPATDDRSNWITDFEMWGQHEVRFFIPRYFLMGRLHERFGLGR